VILTAIVSIVGVTSYGYYDTRFKPWHQPIVRVNDRVFDMRYYVKMLRLQGGGQYSQNLQQMKSAAEATVRIIQDKELMRQLSQKPDINIVITPEEVEQEIRNAILGSNLANEVDEADFKQRYYQQLGKIHLSDSDYKEMVIEPELLREKLREHIAKGVTQIALQVHTQAILLGTEEEARGIKAKLDSGEDFTQLAKDFSQHYGSQEKGGDMGWLPHGVARALYGPAFEATAFELEPGEVAGPIYETASWIQTKGGYWLIEVLDKNEEEKVHLRAILLESCGKAETIRAELGGNPDDEKFTQLAKDNSLDSASKQKGGDMGWMGEDEMKSRFGEAALKLEIGELSEPIYNAEVSKRGGYWLIKVQDRPKEMDISSDYREVLIAQAFNQWFAQERESNRLESYLNEEKIYWALTHIQG
jgi:parvulin-like peptidyl-prolyl isomerase